jgi:hypothetical protein
VEHVRRGDCFLDTRVSGVDLLHPIGRLAET